MNNKNTTDLSPGELRQATQDRQATRPGNEAFRVSWKHRMLKTALIILSGMIAATIYPPLDWSWLAWLALVPLFLSVWRAPDWKQAWRCGFYWGYGFSLCSFFWLREIEWFIPFLLSGVLGLFPAFWAAAVPWFRWGLLIPVDVQLKGNDDAQRAAANTVPWYREFPLLLALASWWCILEWIRSWVGTGLPWNFLAASQWQNIVLLQIIEYTGVYGVSFLVALVNFALALTIINIYHGAKQGRMARPVSLLLALTLVVATLAGGLFLARRAATAFAQSPKVTFNAAMLQGDISQRRSATEAQSKEALDKYLALTTKAATAKPDLIVWPETAIPDPFRAVGPICNLYREGVAKQIQQNQIPMLIGTIDFEPASDGKMNIVNSTLLLDRSARISDKYSKVHIVPFGEFIPFRAWLPTPVIRMIDMGRDLSRGKSSIPLEVYPGVWAGINICFEDIFSYISRREALAGANMLLVVTNDAWYPTSAEPEQHLANSIFRTIETRLPMVRCGNNSASCLIRPDGVIADAIFKHQSQSGATVIDYQRHGEGIGIFRISAPVNPQLTFYSRFGDLFILLCAMVFISASLSALWQWRQKCLRLSEAFGESATPTSGK